LSPELKILCLTAISVGFLHTLLGPDHYIPFIAMSKAGKWSIKKTVWVTVLSGFGHVLSTIILGFVGIGLGIALHVLKNVESFRGDFAGWALTCFGLLYFLWGIKKSFRAKKHSHTHIHEDGEMHFHNHSHNNSHAHVHQKEGANLTPWIIFTIFIFGPCEALIPILMYPASNISLMGMIMVTTIFAFTTIVTMLSVVILSIYGINFIPIKRFEKYSHAIAGLLIFFSGISVQIFAL